MKIFLSHRSRDKATVREFKSALPHFLQTWIDEDSLLWGESLAGQLQKTIKSDVDFVLLFVANDTLSSEWVTRELGWALERERDLDRTFILPIILADGQLRELPPEISGRYYLVLSSFAHTSVVDLARDASDKLFHLIVDSYGRDGPSRLSRHFPREIPDHCIRNVYAIPEENDQRNERMRELLTGAHTDSIWLLARTGSSYLRDDGKNFRLGIEQLLEAGKQFQIILENPHSPAAESRWKKTASGDPWGKLRPERIRELLETYENLEIRFTDLPAYCSLFFVGDSVIYDPYHLGRTKPTTGTTGSFGNEFLVFEFSGVSNKYYHLLKDHFNFLWTANVKTFSQIEAIERRAASRKLATVKRRLESGKLSVHLSKDYVFEPIAYHDSWLSIDPIVGCQMACQYCYMNATGWTGVPPQLLMEIPEVVQLLVESRYFNRNETVLCFGNHTDAFLEANIDHTKRFIDELERRRLANPVVLVTKKKVPECFAERMSQLNYVRPIFFLTYSGLPPSIDKGVLIGEVEESFRILSARKLNVVHFWRPLTEVNGSEDSLSEVLAFARKHACASVYCGLRLGRPVFEERYRLHPSLKLPLSFDRSLGDYIPEEVEKRLLRLRAVQPEDYPIYKHTSCAVSFVLGTPDYTATVYRDEVCKSRSNCPIHHRRICEGSRRVPSDAEVHALLRRLGIKGRFEIKEGGIHIGQELKQEDYAFLLHRLKVPIHAPVARSRNLWGSIFEYAEKLMARH